MPGCRKSLRRRVVSPNICAQPAIWPTKTKKVTNISVHDGHRQRLKNRFLRQGLDGFDDHNVLELLLFYAIPRRDTNPIAHELLSHFGSLEAVFEASADELSLVEGMGECAASLLKLIPEVSRRYSIDKAEKELILNSTTAAGNYLLPRFMYERDEVVYVICLDAKNKVLCCRELFRGAPNMAEISIRKIIELVIAKNATGIIISHNHISGIAVPSMEDEETTRRIGVAMRNMGVKLIDHIIIAGNDFVSMADSGMMH